MALFKGDFGHELNNAPRHTQWSNNHEMI